MFDCQICILSDVLLLTPNAAAPSGIRSGTHEIYWPRGWFGIQQSKLMLHDKFPGTSYIAQMMKISLNDENIPFWPPSSV